MDLDRRVRWDVDMDGTVRWDPRTQSGPIFHHQPCLLQQQWTGSPAGLPQSPQLVAGRRSASAPPSPSHHLGGWAAPWRRHGPKLCPWPSSAAYSVIAGPRLDLWRWRCPPWQHLWWSVYGEGRSAGPDIRTAASGLLLPPLHGAAPSSEDNTCRRSVLQYWRWMKLSALTHYCLIYPLEKKNLSID